LPGFSIRFEQVLEQYNWLVLRCWNDSPQRRQSAVQRPSALRGTGGFLPSWVGREYALPKRVHGGSVWTYVAGVPVAREERVIVSVMVDEWTYDLEFSSMGDFADAVDAAFTGIRGQGGA